MKRILLVLSLLLTMGLSAQVAAAQVEPGDGLDTADVEGLKSGYSRTYSVDMEAMMASPSADLTDMSAMMRNVTISGYTFESDDNASDFLSDMRGQVDEELKKELGSMGEVEVSDLDDFGDGAFKVTIAMDDLGMALVMHVFVDGDTIFTVMTMDADVESADALALGVSTYIKDAEVKDEEVTFNEDGTSTGGIFDRMPAGGDEVVAGLAATADVDLMAQ